MTYLDYLEQKVLLERLVIGLEEPVLIKGLGELSAKIDSGNGGYNVIHGTDFHQQGNELMFTTHDSFGHEKKMQATVIDTIEVNMGGGNIESRPVIELDIKFAGEDYKKIPFSVSDRSSNTNPILISKGFVENELEALIDVGAMNISHEGIDVVYGESFWQPTTDESPILKAGQKIGGFFDKLGQFGDYLAGTGENPWKGKEKETKQMASDLGHSKEIIEDDTNKITPKIQGLALPNKLSKDQEIDLETNVVDQWANNKIDVNDFPKNLVTCYMMTKGNIEDKNEIKGLESERKAWKEWIQTAKGGVAKEKENRQGKGKSATPDNETAEEQEEGSANPTTPTAEVTPAVDKTPTENAGDKPSNEGNDDFQAVTTQFEQLSTFSLWFISFNSDLQKKQELENKIAAIKERLENFEKTNKQADEKALKYKKQLENLIPQYEKQLKEIGLPSKEEYEKEMNEYIQSGSLDDTLYKLFKSGTVTPESVKPVVEKLAQIFQKDGKQGFFCLAWTPQSQSELKEEMKDIKRQHHFYEDLSDVSYTKKKKEETTTEQPEKKEEETKQEEVTDTTDDANVIKTEETPEGEVTVGDTKIVSGDSSNSDGDEKSSSDDADEDDDDGLSEEDKEWIKKFNSLQPNYNHEAEEEPWVEEKINLFKKKGLI